MFEQIAVAGWLNNPAPVESHLLPAAIHSSELEGGATSAMDYKLARLMLINFQQTGASPITYVLSDIDDKQLEVNKGQLEYIKSSMGLNMSQLAKLIGVSRPQLYKWFDGDAVPQRAGFNQRISLIADLIRDIPEEHLRYFGKLSKRYIASGETFLDTLAAQDLTKDQFNVAYGAIKEEIVSLMARSSNAKASNKPGPILPPS